MPFCYLVNEVLERNQDITYNAMMRPSSISEGGKTTNFYYDADASRIKMQTKQGDLKELTRYYIGSQYEYDNTPEGNEERLFLDGDAYAAPAVFVKKNQKEYLYYLGRDYLGSITHVLDADGNLLQELSYDAWGRLRKPENHELYAQGSEIEPILGGRGYTGHEHLTYYGLINMNARLYDPVVGRFLSPDPYIQAPNFSQNYNRYSYALNNPLLYIDPSGEALIIDDIVGAVIGGVVNLGVNIWQGNITGSPWEMIGKGAAAFGAGAVGGVLATYGPVGWAAAGAIIGGTNAAISGQNIAQGMFIGAASGLVGGYAGNWAASSLGSVSINGYSIASPLIKGAAAGTVGGAIGGYTSGFTSGLLLTGNLSAALESGYSGLKFGAVLGMFSGVREGYKYAKDNGLNIWNGEIKLKVSTDYDFSYDPYGDNVKLYRGTTGSEKAEGNLFMTTDKSYAESYIKNGGTLTEIVIPRSTLFQMQQNGLVEFKTGTHFNITNTPIQEYMFTPKGASLIYRNFNFKP